MGDYSQVCCGAPGVRSAKAKPVCVCVCILQSVRVFSHLSRLPTDV